MPDRENGPSERLSRFMCLLLRHRPSVAGLDVDEEGWVPLSDFVEAVRTHWKRGGVSDALIRDIAQHDPKGRYEVDPEGPPPRIRATYGHSLPVRVVFPEVEPPDLLYHGTGRRFLQRIRTEGLRPMDRQYVHLTDNLGDAWLVGERRDPRPAIITVAAARMAGDGYRFFHTSAGIYLTESVPSAYLVCDPDTRKVGGDRSR